MSSLSGIPARPRGFSRRLLPIRDKGESGAKSAPRFSRIAEVGRAPTRGPKKTRGRAGSPTRAARAFSFFSAVAPPYPKGGVYGGVESQNTTEKEYFATLKIGSVKPFPVDVLYCDRGFRHRDFGFRFPLFQRRIPV